jgi:integrating conjugative element protein (TIGR03759 family)
MPDKKRLATAAALALICCSGAFAVATSVTSPTQTTVQHLNEREAVTVALRWGLTQQEWREYETIMAGKRGLWSPAIDPLSALGIHAVTLEERQHYADLYVQAEFKRVEKELAFQRAVNGSWRRLFPNTPRIAKQARTVSGGPVVRYGIVVAMDCRDCEQALNKHLALLDTQTRLQGIDIYVVGSRGEDAALRAWVNRHDFPLQQIKNRTITVNHGTDYADADYFPLIFAKEEGGRWRQQ